MYSIIGRQIENMAGSVGDEARHTETGLKGAYFVKSHVPPSEAGELW